MSWSVWRRSATGYPPCRANTPRAAPRKLAPAHWRYGGRPRRRVDVAVGLPPTAIPLAPRHPRQAPSHVLGHDIERIHNFCGGSGLLQLQLGLGDVLVGQPGEEHGGDLDREVGAGLQLRLGDDRPRVSDLVRDVIPRDPLADGGAGIQVKAATPNNTATALFHHASARKIGTAMIASTRTRFTGAAYDADDSPPMCRRFSGTASKHPRSSWSSLSPARVVLPAIQFARRESDAIGRKGGRVVHCAGSGAMATQKMALPCGLAAHGESRLLLWLGWVSSPEGRTACCVYDVVRSPWPIISKAQRD